MVGLRGGKGGESGEATEELQQQTLTPHGEPRSPELPREVYSVF